MKLTIYCLGLASVSVELQAAAAEWEALKSRFSKQWREVSLKEYGTYALFAGETYAWFCAGKIVGRGFRFVDYDYE